MVSPPSPGWQWFLRLAGIILNIAVLTITARDVHAFLQVACSPPSKLSYNLATSVLSFCTAIYLVFPTGPTPKFRLLPCPIWLPTVLDTVMFGLWLAAAVTSKLNCNDLCTACSTKTEINYGNSLCPCFDHISARNYPPTPRKSLHLRDWTSSTSSSEPIFILKQCLDIVITILFLICLTADLYWLRTTHTKTTRAPNKREKLTPAARTLMRYLVHGATEESVSGPAPQPLTPPRYPQSAYHQQYFHGSVTSLRTSSAQPEPKEDGGGVEWPARSEGAVVQVPGVVRL